MGERYSFLILFVFFTKVASFAIMFNRTFHIFWRAVFKKKPYKTMRIIVLWFLFSLPILAWPAIYGPEFTFTNERLIEEAKIAFNKKGVHDPNYVATAFDIITPLHLDIMESFVDKLKILCKDCPFEEMFGNHGPKVRITYPDGWWFDVGIDYAVIEVNTKPETLETFKRFEKRIKEHIFDVARVIGIAPKRGVGGGHIHIGVESAFGGDTEFFVKTFIDFINNSFLFNGVLGLSPNNAIAFNMLPKISLTNFKNILKEYYGAPLSFTVEEIANNIIEKVYSRAQTNYFPHDHYQAIRFNIQETFETIELRAIRAQMKPRDFITILELLDARLNYINNNEKKILFTLKPVSSTKEGLLKQFKDWVNEMGYPWEKARTLVDMPEFNRCKDLFAGILSK